jgi:hypothetical protein
MINACFAAAHFFRPFLRSIRRLKEEWKGKKEWREVMWMMEEEGAVDSMCGRTETHGEFEAKEVLKELGICCSE